ncbi:hypothetical protein SIO53_000922 [Enterobacter roggenkampii]|jgi:hypothetical protein|uniref:hypothetical protein n=1 Tax=Enterobacter roggenkampii TaxID=1812935 RepID=UPI00186619C9|nr:hypothetical protein [Enterobacter roggenkampii]EKM4699956.1 hypothetical protein [Enterobacter roggenkampii]ELW9293556.1 hypothetical protein [Enterobacter roggenkampii]MCK6888577.1 hypothetical protein [Enterobacter roggenkampii]MDH0517529.1 hypothetical protein [Enterobacter roggenkampii]HBM0960915.1 hypothetical protein [Enterobacter roggenkampii]
MGNTATVHGSGKTGMQAKGIKASHISGTRLYFHADSETFLAVDGDELEQESNVLNSLLGHQVDTQMRIDDLTLQCTRLNWGQISERTALQTQIQQEAQRLDDLNKQLKVKLTTLSATEELPKTTLLDNSSKSAVGLMELIEVRGGMKGVRYIYARSDQIDSKWRRYPLEDSDKKSGGKSFVISESYIDNEGNTRTREKIDYDKLKTQISKVKPKMLKAEQDLLEQHTGVLGQWARDMNDSLKHSPYQGERLGFDAQSQLMRWTYGAGLTEELNPFEVDFRNQGKKVKKEAVTSGKASAYASLALAESKSKLTLSLPDIHGITMTYPLKPEMGGGMGSLGVLRFDFELTLAGSVGASLGVELGVSVKSNWAKGVPGPSGDGTAPAPGQRKIDISQVVKEPEATGELTVFAGAQASANLSGAIKWCNPEKNKEYTYLAKVSLGATAQIGAGWSGTFRFSYENGKVQVLARGGMCWGGGGKGSVAFDIDGIAIITDFLPCLTYMLRNADYIKLSSTVIRDGDFYAFCALPLLSSMYGVNLLVDSAWSQTDKLLDNLRDSWEIKEQRVRLMQEIIDTQGECLKFSPPESKGAAIASLIEHGFWDEFASPASNAQTDCEGLVMFSARKRAVLLCLRWVQSKREYENVMQHLSKNFVAVGSWQGNQQSVADFLALGEQPRVYGSKNSVPNASEIKILPSHYAKNLMDIWSSLPSTEEVNGTELHKLKEVSPVLMQSCTRVVVGGQEL